MNQILSGKFKAAVGVSAIALSMLAQAAQALPIVNGSFEQTIGRPGNTTNPGNPTGGMLATSANFTGPGTTLITLPGWQTTADGIGCVVFPNTYANGVCGSPPSRFGGSGFQMGGPGPSFDGGNFILIDGDRSIPVSTTLYQLVPGLVVGQRYQVSFEQAAAQFLDRSGDTTEQWDVSLGGDPTNLTRDGNIIGGVHILSNLMMTPGGGFHTWENQTLNFQVVDPSLAAGSVTSQVLGFFSVGSPGGQPPIVLLDGVAINAVPEPATLSLLSVGLLGFVVMRLRRKSKIQGVFN